jgi:hypothetical protein
VCTHVLILLHSDRSRQTVPLLDHLCPILPNRVVISISHHQSRVATLRVSAPSRFAITISSSHQVVLPVFRSSHQVAPPRSSRRVKSRPLTSVSLHQTVPQITVSSLVPRKLYSPLLEFVSPDFPLVAPKPHGMSDASCDYVPNISSHITLECVQRFIFRRCSAAVSEMS